MDVGVEIDLMPRGWRCPHGFCWPWDINQDVCIEWHLQGVLPEVSDFAIFFPGFQVKRSKDVVSVNRLYVYSAGTRVRIVLDRITRFGTQTPLSMSTLRHTPFLENLVLSLKREHCRKLRRQGGGATRVMSSASADPCYVRGT